VKPIIQAYNFQGEIIKKKKLLYQILLNNQPFLHIIRFAYRPPKIIKKNLEKHELVAKFEKRFEKII